MEGWIKSYRQTIENPIVCKDSDHVAVWMYLLWNATHKQIDMLFGGKRITLQPGELITSRRSISIKFKVSESKVQRILKLFESEHQIEQRISNINRLISIVNWSEYQDSEHQSEHQVNTNRTPSEHQVNTNKNVKNERTKNNNTSGEKSPVTLHTLCKDLFHEKFRSLFGDEYYWEAKDAANLNAITKKIKRNRELKGLPTDDDKILFAFGAFIDNIKDRWLLENFSIPNINSKFNEIISQAKQNGHRKQQQTTTDDELLENIKAGIKRGITENSIQ